MATSKNKKERLNPRKVRQELILKKHYCVDNENKIMTIDFKYDSASDIFRDNVSPTQVPMIEHELIDNVTFFFDRIPDDYKLNLNYQINDLQEYSFDEIAEAYVDVLELDHCLSCKRSKKVGFNAILLIVIGCCFMILYSVCSAFKYFASLNGQIIGYIIDCVAYAFIFNGLGILFIHKDEEVKNNQMLMDKLHSVSFIDKDNNKVITRNKSEITKYWKFDSKKERVDAYSFLAAGTVLSVLGAIIIIGFLISLYNGTFKNANATLIVSIAFHLFTAVVDIFAGIACFSKYLERGPLIKSLIPITIVLSLCSIADTVFIFVVFAKSGQNIGGTIITVIITLLVSLFITFEAFKYRNKSKKDKKHLH